MTAFTTPTGAGFTPLARSGLDVTADQVRVPLLVSGFVVTAAQCLTA